MRLNWLRGLDVYRKVEQDLTKQTYSGAVVSIIAVCLMLFLFISEFITFLTIEVKTDMFVEDPLHTESEFDVLFSITLPHMSCAIVGVDIQDAMGRHEVGLESLLRKRRYSADGQQLAMHDHEAHNGDLQKQFDEQRGESCNVHGHLRLGKIPGNFHLSTHSVHSRVAIPEENINFSHTIEHLNMGEHLGETFDIPGAFTPLNGRHVETADLHVAFEYHLRIVPTIYITIDGEKRTSYQFTFAYKEHRDNHHYQGGGMPSALYFRYDLSPITVRYTEQRKPFFSFVIQLCAIIGGVFTVAGIVDSVIYHGNKLLLKQELGKLG